MTPGSGRPPQKPGNEIYQRVRTVNSTLHLALAGSLDALTIEFLSTHSLIAAAGSKPSLAIVFAWFSRRLHRSVLEMLDRGQPISTLDAASGLTAGSLRENSTARKGEYRRRCAGPQIALSPAP